MKKNEPTNQTTETQDNKEFSTIGVRKVPMSLKESFVDALMEEKVGQQSLFLMWIVRLVVARPKKFIQMCRDLEKEIEAELTTK